MSSLGFLLWNWPPAKIFMGDVAGGFLGYIIAVLVLICAHEQHVSLWAWLIFWMFHRGQYIYAVSAYVSRREMV